MFSTRLRLNVVLLFIFGFSLQANATEMPRCYEIKIKNSAEANFSIETKTEVWCYQHLLVENKLFIYNADHKDINPTMALLIDAKGIITHASLLAGQITVHKVNQKDFNPYSVPLQEPHDQVPIFRVQKINPFQQSTLTLLNQAEDIAAATFVITDMKFLSARAAILPWQGFWWPRKNMPLLRPLAKYDHFVQARTGVNPGSEAWEMENHAYHGVSWSGHCNGWAAASILHPEPRLQKTDSVSGVTFSPSDQKGILTEADYCIGASFFGNRNYGAGNNGDIRPELFHKTLLYYIGSLQKPVITDYRSDSSVDNHVISGYDMIINPAGENTYNVTATLSMHGYDNFISELSGIARPYKRVYTYVLQTSADGVPISGYWLSGNPDFIWVPLALQNCQKLDYNYINSILNLQ